VESLVNLIPKVNRTWW